MNRYIMALALTLFSGAAFGGELTPPAYEWLDTVVESANGKALDAGATLATYVVAVRGGRGPGYYSAGYCNQVSLSFGSANRVLKYSVEVGSRWGMWATVKEGGIYPVGQAAADFGDRKVMFIRVKMEILGGDIGNVETIAEAEVVRGMKVMGRPWTDWDEDDCEDFLCDPDPDDKDKTCHYLEGCTCLCCNHASPCLLDQDRDGCPACCDRDDNNPDDMCWQYDDCECNCCPHEMPEGVNNDPVGKSYILGGIRIGARRVRQSPGYNLDDSAATGFVRVEEGERYNVSYNEVNTNARGGYSEQADGPLTQPGSVSSSVVTILGASKFKLSGLQNSIAAANIRVREFHYDDYRDALFDAYNGNRMESGESVIQGKTFTIRAFSVKGLVPGSSEEYFAELRNRIESGVKIATATTGMLVGATAIDPVPISCDVEAFNRLSLENGNEIGLTFDDDPFKSFPSISRSDFPPEFNSTSSDYYFYRRRNAANSFNVSRGIALDIQLIRGATLPVGWDRDGLEPPEVGPRDPLDERPDAETPGEGDDDDDDDDGGGDDGDDDDGDGDDDDDGGGGNADGKLENPWTWIREAGAVTGDYTISYRIPLSMIPFGKYEDMEGELRLIEYLERIEGWDVFIGVWRLLLKFLYCVFFFESLYKYVTSPTK